MAFYRVGLLLLAELLCPCFAQGTDECDGGSCPVRPLDGRADLESDEHAALQTRAAAGHRRSADSAAGAEEAAVSGGDAGHRPPRSGRCLHYSVTAPTFSKSRVIISQVQVRYTIVDVATVAQPLVHSKTGGIKPIPLDYNGYETPREGNSIYSGFGKGMFSIYYIGYNPMGSNSSDADITVVGLMPNCAYVSIEFSYGSEDRVVYTGSDLNAVFADGSPAPNPFAPGNPTVLAYTQQAVCAKQSGSSLVEAGSESSQGGGAMAVRQQPQQPQLPQLPQRQQPQQQQEQQQEQPQAQQPQHQAGDEAVLLEAFTLGCEPTNTNVYRLSEDLSKAIDADGGTLGKCADTYLFSPAITAGALFSIPKYAYVFAYGFLKMKVPTAFNPFKELTFKGPKSPEKPDGYDTLAFTISSNWMIPPGPNVPFGVNSLMLRESGFNIKGVAIVLFAPADKVKALSRPSDMLPPVVFIPRLKLKAYLLPAPDYAFIFRYRGPSEHWKGSPGNAECYSNLQDSVKAPATCQQLGDTLPQITRVDGVNDIAGLVGRIG